jgi:arylformamidase
MTESRIVDLSHRVTNGMRVYPGIPAPSISAFLTHEQSRARYDGQCELTFSEVRVVAGVGTYLDSPYHREAGLPDHASLRLDALVDLPGEVLDLRGRASRAIDASDIPAGSRRGRALILFSGMDAHWDTDRYWNEGPFLTAGAADALVASGVALLGVDFLNVDDTADPRRPAHTKLLKAGIPIIENLRNVGALPPTGFRLHAATLPMEGVASFPIRAYAMVVQR